MTEAEDVRSRLDQASRVIAGARRDLEAGEPTLAADRAYYAMFYAAEALLNDRGLQFSSHGAVHGAFGRHFAKSGVLDTKFHRWLLDAFRMRQKAVYDAVTDVEDEAARQLITQADEFLAAAKEFLRSSD